MKQSLALLICVLAISALSASPAHAKQPIGDIGLGYTTSNAPVGIRMWFSEAMGFDVGLGLLFNGEEDAPETRDDPDDRQTTVDFALDAGFMYAFANKENSKLYIRGGLNLDRRYARGQNDNNEAIDSSILTLTISAWAGAEFFFTEWGFPELGLQGAVGLGFQNISGPDRDDPQPDDSDWTFGTLTTGLSLVGTAVLGFHYYF